MTGGDTVRVAGVDGARGGWICVTLSGRSASSALFGDFAAVRRAVDDQGTAVVAVDMPLGLPDSAPRQADRAARARLLHRRSTFFPTPGRVVLDATSHDDASRRNRDALGVGISVQAWNLVPRIRELRDAVEPAACDRFVECHPETTFTTLAGAPLDPKKTDTGIGQRIEVLRPFIDDLDELVDGRPCAMHDLLDAAAAAISARRHVDGVAEVLGAGLDATGYPLEVIV